MFTNPKKSRFTLHWNLSKRNQDPGKSVHPAPSKSPPVASPPSSSRGVSSKLQGTRFWLFLGLRVEVLRKALGTAVGSLGCDIGRSLAANKALAGNSNFDFSIRFKFDYRRHNLDPDKAIESSKRNWYLDNCIADHNFDNCLEILGHQLAGRWQVSSENLSTGF